MKKIIDSGWVKQLLVTMGLWAFLLSWQGFIVITLNGVEWNFPVDYPQKLIEAIIIAYTYDWLKDSKKGPRL